MWEVLFEPAADAAMTALEQEPSAAALVHRLNAALRALAMSPGDARFRRRSYAPVGHMWGFLVRWRDDDRLLIWKYGPNDGQLTIRYIGPDL